MKKIFMELTIVTASGIVIGLLANAVAYYGGGLRLFYNYFPKGHTVATRPVSVPPTTTSGPAVPPTSQQATLPTIPSQPSVPPNADAHLDEVIAELKDEGLQVISHNEVTAIYEDALYQSGAYVFVDARDANNYASGHVPNAYHLDAYRFSQSLPEVLPMLQQAFKIVVYCNGGKCEDSKFAAHHLRDEAGINPSFIYVYANGMDEWKKKDLPVETGERGSGTIVQGHTLIGGKHE
jgi:rhodanese-related sulfurtransferase